MPVMPFHLALPVTSLDKARAFYGGLLGCPEGRSSPEWVDFDSEPHIRSRNKLLMRAAPSHPGQIAEIHGAIP